MEKEKSYAIQGIISTAGAWIVTKTENLFSILMILIALMVIDQISGMLASKKEAMEHLGDENYGWSSSKSIKGIYKKMGYILTVAVAIVTDYLIFIMSSKMGIEFKTNTMFGMLVAIWFIINELLSILENAGRMGVELPAFLKHVLSELKKKVENKDENEKS